MSDEHPGPSSAHSLSILDVLRPPTRSKLTRKRKVDSNPPPKGKRRARGEGSTEPKTVSPRQRVDEFPDERLTVTGKGGSRLFCNACREELSLRRNVIANHVASNKHKTSKEKLVSRDSKERDIAQFLAADDALTHRVGETLPMEQRVYRLKVLKTFLRAAVPLSKLDAFRDLLEENSFRLTDRRHMSDLVPLIVAQEQADIKAEFAGKPVSVVFDGTTRLGEAMAIVVRFVDNSFAIQQRLLRLQLLTKSMTGEEIARVLINTLSAEYGISSSHVLAAMHDRAACNGVAMRTLKIVFPAIVDIGCFSHTLDLVGGKFSTPVLSSFMVWWISLFSHSPKSMLLWKERTGQAYHGYSATRWWSKFEVMKQLLDLFGDVLPFLELNTSISPATRGKLLSILHDPHEKSHLMVELAVTIDAGMPFVKATYNLEGDGPLALTCYEAISTLNAAARQAYYPNLMSVASQISSGDSQMESELVQHAKSCVQPGLTYYFQQISASMRDPLAAFKAARLFSPSKLNELNPSTAAVDSRLVDSLATFPFLTLALPALKEEFPHYIAAAEDIDSSYNPLTFWKGHEDDLPNWSKAARQVLLVQPSSASSERVFSLLRNSFGERQHSSLQDYIEASLMLQYNKR